MIQLTCRFLPLLLSLLLLVSTSDAQDDEAEDYASGLIATIVRKGKSIEQLVPNVSQVINPQGTDGASASAPESITWRGFLFTQGRGEYHFHIFAQGRVRFTLEGKTLIDSQSQQSCWHGSEVIELPYGYHPLEVTLQTNGALSQLRLFWDGPQFQREPVPHRQFFHERAKYAANSAAYQNADTRGEALTRALRCAACHDIEGIAPPDLAPELVDVKNNLSWPWLIDWLSASSQPKNVSQGSDDEAQMLSRRMPHFGLSREDATAIAAFLWQGTAKASEHENKNTPKQTKKEVSNNKPPVTSDNKKSKTPKPKTPEELIASGQKLALTLGCVACHQVESFGKPSLFGGTDLRHIGDKRPTDFFSRWLSAPEKINAQHRMPVFSLSNDENKELSAYLATLKSDKANTVERPSSKDFNSLRQQGESLFKQYQCAQCHRTPAMAANEPVAESNRPRIRLNASSRWKQGCSERTDRNGSQPTYLLSQVDQQKIREFVSSPSSNRFTMGKADWLLAEHQCLVCHLRDSQPGLAPLLTEIGTKHSELAPLLPAMTPPPLTSVGDKLRDEALTQAISRTGEPHRPYLSVRMPRFRFNQGELEEVVKHFVAEDRIPSHDHSLVNAYEATVLDEKLSGAERVAGARLVTTDGFGCTSCHKVGNIDPPNAPLNARGPSLSMLGNRIRPEWFDRWTRNPSRIVPRMEMPSVQLPVQGLLDNDLNKQLVAVWHVLNRPGFQPPRPNPVRVVRLSGSQERQERAIVLTDVIKNEQEKWIKPFLIGLPNRHNLMIDLENNRLSGWWMGDVARQHTQGKTWFWETSGASLLSGSRSREDLVLLHRGHAVPTTTDSQFKTEFDEFWHQGDGIQFKHQVKFNSSDAVLSKTLIVRQFVQPIWPKKYAAFAGVRREIFISGLSEGEQVQWTLAPQAVLQADLSNAREGIRIKGAVPGTIRLVEPEGTSIDLVDDHVVATLGATNESEPLKLVIEYQSEVLPDPFDIRPLSIPQPQAEKLDVVPGYEVIQLPLASEFMPTGLAWDKAGTLFVASLKGDVWKLKDTNADGLEDQATVFSDELAAPYGIAVKENAVDVINKYGLLRLLDEDGDGRADRTVTLASGWGHTDDYHDWAVGLPVRRSGGYYAAIPCQQDDRTEAAAKYRGMVLELVPSEHDTNASQSFSIHPISGGHRFPMGIAVNRKEELFVTDNQGNYNPFNELNHVLPGKRFGFINALERKQPDFNPPLTPPAIDIPHPWTRSVNGICFLETPQGAGKESLFGPFEGHLIGCEYDTRRLVRMSLDYVNGQIQGAVYPFSYEQPKSGSPLLGPVVCAVAPDGDLYVGSLRDSGWGGANNIGSLTRLRPEAELTCGIAEIRCTKQGFKLRFTAAVDRRRAAETARYNVVSYRRESTPAYGGPDLDRRTERVTSVQLSEDAREVAIEVEAMRLGFVYEIQLQSLTSEGKEFFPAEGYYTLREVPR